MTVWVALLRAVNVGGTTVLRMAEVRALVADLGHTDVATYVQSGNVVFRSAQRSEAEVAEGLAGALSAHAGRTVGVVLRTGAQLAAVAGANPWPDDAEHVHVAYFDEAASLPSGLDLAAFAPEGAKALGREVYLHLPGGVGRSKLATELSRGRSRAGANGTMRNWRTTTKLVEMAQAAASSTDR